MSIRSTAKALIINDNKVLLNKCNGGNNGYYYSMPGGGQHKYETLHEAIIRECLEETGYEVTPLKIVGVCEEICLDIEIRETHPDYAHKMHHIFLCALTNGSPKMPTEKDSMQIGSEWVSVKSLGNVRLLPKVIGNQIIDVINGVAPIFLGSEQISFNHG